MLPCLHYDRISNAYRFSIATTRVIASLDSGDPSDHRVSCGYASESIHRSPLSNVIFAEKLPWHDMTKNNVSATATCYAATAQFAQSPDEASTRFPKKTRSNAFHHEFKTWTKLSFFPRYSRGSSQPADRFKRVHRDCLSDRNRHFPVDTWTLKPYAFSWQPNSVDRGIHFALQNYS